MVRSFARNQLSYLIILSGCVLFPSVATGGDPPVTERNIYVKTGANPQGANGVQWSTAFPNLRLGLSAAATATETFIYIRVAAGTYRPSASGVQSTSFVLPPRTTIFGGYEGISGTPGTRDLVNFSTTLSGDLAQDDIQTPEVIASTLDDNSYHVVYANDRQLDAGLDGLVIAGGYAFGDTTPYACMPASCANFNTISSPGGAGLLAIDCTILVRDCVFRHNRAERGGAIRLMCGAPTILHCRFEENSATDVTNVTVNPEVGSQLLVMMNEGNGGAIWAVGCCAAKIEGCAFYRNLSGHVGGAVAVQVRD